jgi:NADH:ubiquinone oxidoreductase subunit D
VHATAPSVSVDGSLYNYALFGAIKTCIESSKGIYGILINSMLPFSSDRAFMVNIVANDFLIITQLNKLTKSENLADVIALLGSLDFVLGSVDLFGGFVGLG